MNIVFVHYHLNSGGVTQVIVNQMRAAAQLKGDARPERVGVLYGGRHEGWPATLWNDFKQGSGVPFDEVLMPLPAIDYDDLPTVREELLAKEVAQLLAENGFAPNDTLLHIHNHSLGKNASWPGAIELLAQQGYRLLLQLHDFIEDFRPTNYRHLAHAWQIDHPKSIAEKQYPQGEGIHYASLTQRDHQLLSLAGVAAERLHTLPNPVGEFVDVKSPNEVAETVRSELGIPGDAGLVIYPVRGIRRKNLGEFLLHAAISPPNTWHAITLAPQNPLELPSFERWKALAAKLDLRCLFDICGNGTSQFLDTLAAADSLITTSVAEGFGMVFLETWLAGKPLIGRDLPGITSDFKSAGIKFDGLYETFSVPMDLVEHRDALPEALTLAYEWACDNYGVASAPREEVAADIAKLIEEDRIDFALLPSRFQEQLIRVAANDPTGVRKAILEVNPGIEAMISGSSKHNAAIESNAATVRSKYSLATIGNSLGATYQAIMNGPAPNNLAPAENGGAILEQFLRIDQLHAIRFEE